VHRRRVSINMTIAPTHEDAAGLRLSERDHLEATWTAVH